MLFLTPRQQCQRLKALKALHWYCIIIAACIIQQYMYWRLPLCRISGANKQYVDVGHGTGSAQRRREGADYWTGLLSWPCLSVSYRRHLRPTITSPTVTHRCSWLGSLAVSALDLRLDGCEFDSRPPRLILDGRPSSDEQSTSVFHQATQANSTSYSHRDGKCVPAKVRWCSAAGE